MMRAMVVLPVPGGPQKTREGIFLDDRTAFKKPFAPLYGLDQELLQEWKVSSVQPMVFYVCFQTLTQINFACNYCNETPL